MLTASKTTPVCALPVGDACWLTARDAEASGLTAATSLLLWLAGTSPICLRLGSDHALGNIKVSKINGAAANGVKIKFHQETPTAGSFTIDLVRAAVLPLVPSASGFCCNVEY